MMKVFESISKRIKAHERAFTLKVAHFFGINAIHVKQLKHMEAYTNACVVYESI